MLPDVKASAHSFKQVILWLLKVSFSLYAPITSDECYAWFHFNAASAAARNTKQVTIAKNLVNGRIRFTNNARPPDYNSTVITTRPHIAWHEIELNVHELYKYAIYKTWKGACVYRIINMSISAL